MPGKSGSLNQLENDMRKAVPELLRRQGFKGNYVNASRVHTGLATSKANITTPHPTTPTFAKFWSMILQEGVSTIVMLNRERKYKYWPTKADPTIFPRFTVSCQDEKQYMNYDQRRFNIQKHNSKSGPQ